MAGWLSSKLRIAETFLNQVDATAALSLTELKHELAHVRPSPHPPPPLPLVAAGDSTR
jgi:hypothetical protein